jgi:acyl carrier protein
MMIDSLSLVSAVVSRIAAESGYDEIGPVGPDTELLSSSSGLDSLTVVQIVAELERECEEKAGKRIVLADDRAMSRRSSPFRTVRTLAELVDERLAE